jgi:hypothetical protein
MPEAVPRALPAAAATDRGDDLFHLFEFAHGGS